MARQSFQRRRPSRPIGRKVIIACEGEKTERGYFESIRQSLRLPTLQVIVVRHEGSDPLHVVQAALDQREMQKEDQNWIAGDMAWAVFDGDEHIAHNPENWHQALQLAEGKGIELAISNPCFELWYLLHYQNQTAHLHRDRACQLLHRCLPDYEKADVLYPRLASLTDQAMDHAQQLAYHLELNDQPFYTNPCAGVWKLVALLLSLQREKR